MHACPTCHRQVEDAYEFCQFCEDGLYPDEGDDPDEEPEETDKEDNE